MGIFCLFLMILPAGAEELKPADLHFKEGPLSRETSEKQTVSPQTKGLPANHHVREDVRKLEYPETTGRIPSLRIFFQGLPDVPYLGFITAQKLGYYKEAGLPEVQLLWMNESQDACELLMLGQADFVSAWMIEGYLACAGGQPIVAISQTAQRSSCGVCVRKIPGSEIQNIEQLDGKKIGIWCRKEGIPRFFFAHKQMHPEFIVQNSFSFFLMKKKVLDALFYTSYSAKTFAEIYKRRDMFTFFDFDTYGVNIPEDALFCRRSFIKRYPDIAEKFVRASWKGWKFVADNPQEAIQMLREQRIRFSLSADSVQLRKQLQVWMDILMLDANLDQNGHCSKDGFAQMRTGLIKNGTLHKDAPHYEDFFYNILDPKDRIRIKK
ncbi:MAG: ABC transporter substrate-binding protein [Planctomycetia bacterium]|nr:ABC transporter substrate-binding protein [Planctomycetia bacterium]